jgi:hypothetical protein
MCWKHTFADLIAPNDFCHTFEHKKAGVDHLMKRVNGYPVSPQGKSEKSQIERIYTKTIYIH